MIIPLNYELTHRLNYTYFAFRQSSCN